MRKAAEDLVEQHLKSGMKVLDVEAGGGTSRFATHVIDLMPYDIWLREWKPEGVVIPRENWTGQDICDYRSWPFPDKFFDFIICSHTLEDVRDPVRVCEEMTRVGKAGYVETPSPFLELTRGLNTGWRARKWIGFYHHRWLIWEEQGILLFRYKPHCLHSSRRFHFPRRYAKKLFQEDKAYTCFFWEGSCPGREEIVVDQSETERDIESIIFSGEGRNCAMQAHDLCQSLWNIGKLWSKRMGIYRHVRSVVRQLW